MDGSSVKPWTPCPTVNTSINCWPHTTHTRGDLPVPGSSNSSSTDCLPSAIGGWKKSPEQHNDIGIGETVEIDNNMLRAFVDHLGSFHLSSEARTQTGAAVFKHEQGIVGDLIQLLDDLALDI